MPSETATQAKQIIADSQLQAPASALLDYWENHPPTVGHGFSHILKVVNQAYAISQFNHIDSSSLVLGALYHDIYRPAKAEGGNEDQTPGADITKQILDRLGTPPATVAQIHSALLTHDSWRGQPDAPLYSVLLSLADKAAHNTISVYGYAWASNKNAGRPVYTSHLQNLQLFSKYQTRAWEVIYHHQLPGHELAAKAYLDVYQFISDQYRSDPTNKNFLPLLDHTAEVYRAEELSALQTFGRSHSSITKIMSLC